MAKHIRRTAEVDTQRFYDEWYASGDERLDLSLARAERIANETGVDVETARTKMMSEYWESRNEAWATANSNSEEKEQVLLVRNNGLDSTCSVFQRADRILTNLPIEVFLNDVEDKHTPAWNDGKNITFNSNAIPAIDEDTIRSLHGLNYHELAHLMFTPRVGTALGKWVAERDDNGNFVNPKRHHAFNILEDCRAEYYMTTKYPSVRPFFTATLGDYIATDQEALGKSFFLLAGRRYFPIEARRLSAHLYAMEYGEEQAKQVYYIISQYRTLVYPRDYTRGQELIEQLMALLPNDVNTPNGCGGRPLMRNGKPVSEKEQDKIVSQDTEKGDELGEPNFGWGDEADTNDGKLPEHADFNESKSGELADTVNEAVKRAKSDKELVKKVTDTTRAIIKDGSTKSILGKASNSPQSPAQSEVTATRLFGQELERLRIDSDPAWIIEKPTGKLNVRRAMNADVNDINKLFDRWEMGNDDYDIEASILIDRSGSMYSEIGSACRSAWVIKRAIEKIDGRVSVMTFGTIARTLYSADEKASGSEVRMIEASGGTQPYYALLESQRIMAQSNSKTKLMFLLTDGDFDNNTSDTVIERMKKDGVYVCVVYLGSEGHLKYLNENPQKLEAMTHKAHDFRAITKPIDLVKVAKDVVKHHLTKGK
jgi:hypothetical protein